MLYNPFIAACHALFGMTRLAFLLGILVGVFLVFLAASLAAYKNDCRDQSPPSTSNLLQIRIYCPYVRKLGRTLDGLMWNPINHPFPVTLALGN